MMGQKIQVEIPQKKIESFCKRHHIRRLSLFGSVLRADFRADSDVDVLVEFDPAHVPGLIRLAGMEFELSEILGRKVDIRTAQDLSRYFRQEVLNSAEVQYAER
jgi:predicted nucleotidyltransferase